MRVALYARVSTQRQAQAQTVEQQLERLTSYAAQQGWSIPIEHVFRDDGYSGASLKRPGLDRLRDLAAARSLDLVLITAPDRLARHYVHQVLLLEEMEQHGCRVQFLERPMSQDPHDQLLLQIRGTVAEYERTLITERMRRGRQRKLAAGLLLPWTKPPFGYRVDPERPRDPAGVRIEESEAAVVREMFAWYADESHSFCSLARLLHERGLRTATGLERWNLASIRGLLTNPAYMGKVYGNRWRRRGSLDRRSATAPSKHSSFSRVDMPREEWILVAQIPALVSEEQWERVQARLIANRRFAHRNNKAHPYLLRNLVSCGVCGLSCLARTTIHQLRYYSCTGKLPALFSHREQKCPSRLSPAERLEELVWANLCELLTHPEQVTQALERAHGGHWLPQELQARRDGLHRGQASLTQQLERLTDAYLAGVVLLEEYRRRRTDLEQRLQALAEQQKHLDAQVDRRHELAGLSGSIEDFCVRVRQGLHQASFEQKRQLIELLIDRVIVTDGGVEIRYVWPMARHSEQVRFCHLRLDYRARSSPHSPAAEPHAPVPALPSCAACDCRHRASGQDPESPIRVVRVEQETADQSRPEMASRHGRVNTSVDANTTHLFCPDDRPLSAPQPLEQQLLALDQEILRQSETAGLTKALELIKTVPGIQQDSAMSVLAEVGSDMSAFPSSAHLSSWAGLCPGNRRSAGKDKGGRTTRGNRWLRATLTQCAWAASAKKDCDLRGKFWRLAAEGKKHAIVAVAHNLLVLVYQVLATGQP